MTHIMLHLHWFYVNITVTKMLITSLNFDQNQRIFFLNEAQNPGCLLKKTEILSEAQKNGNKNGKTNHCIIYRGGYMKISETILLAVRNHILRAQTILKTILLRCKPYYFSRVDYMRYTTYYYKKHHQMCLVLMI